MSVKLTNRAWKIKMPSGQKFLFVALCDYANDKGFCYPSREALGERCDYGLNTVTSHIKWLKANDWIKSERRQKGGNRLSDSYQINMEKLFGESSKNECLDSEHSKSDGSDFEPCKVQILGGVGSDFEPTYKEEPSMNHQNNNNTGAGDSPMVSAVFAPYFAMPLDWRPADREMVQTRLRLSQIPPLETDLCGDALLNFTEFWHARPDVMKTAAQWDAAFLQSVRGYKTNYGHRYNRDGSRKDLDGQTAVSAAAPVQAAPVSATARSLACLQTAHQAVKDGTAQIATPPAVFAVVVEGLADLLGQGLKYPPAADAWGFTLQIWDKAFSERNLTADDDARRVAEAFTAAKQTALNSPEQTFPKPHEVLARLPMRMVARQLGYAETEEEREQRKAKGREQIQGIKDLLKGGKVTGAKA